MAIGWGPNHCFGTYTVTFYENFISWHANELNVLISCRNLEDYIRIAEKVKVFFHNEGIHSTTIQPEFVEVRRRRSDLCLTIRHNDLLA